MSDTEKGVDCLGLKDMVRPLPGSVRSPSLPPAPCCFWLPEQVQLGCRRRPSCPYPAGLRLSGGAERRGQQPTKEAHRKVWSSFALIPSAQTSPNFDAQAAEIPVVVFSVLSSAGGELEKTGEFHTRSRSFPPGPSSFPF